MSKNGAAFWYFFTIHERTSLIKKFPPYCEIHLNAIFLRETARRIDPFIWLSMGPRKLLGKENEKFSKGNLILNQIPFRRHRALWAALNFSVISIAEDSKLIWYTKEISPRFSEIINVSDVRGSLYGYTSRLLSAMSRRVSLCMQPGRPGFNIGSAQDGEPSCVCLSLLSRLPSRRTSRIIHLTCNWFSNKPPTTRHEHEHVCARRHARTVTGRKRTNVGYLRMSHHAWAMYLTYLRRPNIHVSSAHKVLRKMFVFRRCSSIISHDRLHAYAT